MQTVILAHESLSGDFFKATFLPEKGMNLISFKKGGVEVIEQSTLSLFEERYAGLGALIGPHFHHRKVEVIPQVQDESLFPHIARVKSKGVKEPFSHGIARYAPWSVESSQTEFKATLSGKDKWNGIPLADLEGQNFKMTFSGKLSENGLALDLSIVSDTDSLVGIHYYYSLPGGEGKIISRVKSGTSLERDLKSNYEIDEQGQCIIDLNPRAVIDHTFYPATDSRKGLITLETSKYTLKTHYQCVCEENCWQLYHPENASFVCIEPISAQDPRHPNLSVSSLHIDLEILA